MITVTHKILSNIAENNKNNIDMSLEAQYQQRIDYNRGLDNLSNSIDAKEFDTEYVAPYREQYAINGKIVYRCEWNGCDYETYTIETIIHHINHKHIGIKCSKPKCGKTFDDMIVVTHKILHNNTENIETNNDISLESQKQQRIVHKSGSDSSNNVRAEVVKQNREQIIVNGIHVEHVGVKGMRCLVTGCGKSFKLQHTLTHHLRNHLCGFHIDKKKYKKGKGLCSLNNLKKYYKTVPINDANQKGTHSYVCKWPECSFSCPISTSIQRHVHSQHICPNRVSEKSINDIRTLLSDMFPNNNCFALQLTNQFSVLKTDMIGVKNIIVNNNEENIEKNSNMRLESQKQQRIVNKTGSESYLTNNVSVCAEVVKQNHKQIIENSIHVNEMRCSVSGCLKSFKHTNTLSRHLRNHLCGFRIDKKMYKNGKGLCSNYNINKYYKRVEMNDANQKSKKYSYVCQWPECSISCPFPTSIRRHIHSQHICPNRVGEKSIKEIRLLLSKLYPKNDC